ncbi:MAG: hypothetical protein KIT84_14245 [Labilithrix sp.]|nr:hypothetical protein [Labilithrix sp.]MCW5812182.1 hypothetical protein [Labilithrix sp.]
MKLGPLAAAASSLFVASVASADALTVTPEAGDVAALPVVHERRGGLVVGAAGGLGLIGASGYPNNAKFYNDRDYYSETPLLVGWSTSFFAMLALTDWVSVGPSFTISEADTAQWKSTALAGGLRAEFFPLVHAVPRLADLAIYGQVGVGAVALRAHGPYPTSDGVQSFVGVGVHHEWRFVDFLGAHASVGPYLEYDAVRSEPSDRNWLSLGLRVALYTSGNKSD